MQDIEELVNVITPIWNIRILVKTTVNETKKGKIYLSNM